MSETPEHDTAATEAIAAELVRLTLGGRPGPESWHLSVTLAAALKRMGRQFDAFARGIGVALMPAMGEAVRAMADMESQLAKVAKAMNYPEERA